MAKEIIWILEKLGPESLERMHPGLKVESIIIGNVGSEQYPQEGVKITFKEEPQGIYATQIDAMMKAHGYSKQLEEGS